MGRVATDFSYLATIVAFILALRFLSSPATARRGNWIGAVGMLIAVVVTFVQKGIVSYWEIAVGMVIGGAAALVSLAEFHRQAPAPGSLHGDISATIMLSALIGSVSFAGSMVAFAKLQELIQGRPIVYPGQKVLNLALLGLLLAAGFKIIAGVARPWIAYAAVLG